MPKDGKYKDKNSVQKKDAPAVFPEWKGIKNDSDYAACNYHGSRKPKDIPFALKFIFKIIKVCNIKYKNIDKERQYNCYIGRRTYISKLTPSDKRR